MDQDNLKQEQTEPKKIEHRGRRPLPVSEKKQKIVLFLTGAEIKKLGGIEKAKLKIKKFLKYNV